MALKSLILALGFAATLATANAEEIVVSNYGVAANGMPYAVAMAKGFFKQNGADVTGILTSEGGGTTVRTLLGGNLAFGEINLTAPVIAVQQGADLKIISDNVQTVAEFVWAVPKRLRSRRPRTSRARRSATPIRARPARRSPSSCWRPPGSSPPTRSW